MFTMFTAFLSLVFFLGIGIESAITGGDNLFALVTALGAWWSLSALVKELLG